MARRILLSSKDENYLMNLALKFYTKLDENVQITIITDYIYLAEYVNGGFSSEEILVIDKEYYFSSLNYSIFETVVVLDDNQAEDCVVCENVIAINKFANVGYIYDCITAHTSLKEEVMKYTSKDTKIISIYSPIGGAGKTTLAYGICCTLSKAYKRVLYVNIDGLQDFGCMFNTQENINSNLERCISSQDESLKERLAEITGKYIFDYVKPTRMSMFSVGISLKNYIHMIDEIRGCKEYDYIVVDMVSEFNKEIATIISQSNKVLCVGLQDKNSAFRFRKLIDNIDTSDEKKFMFVCNKYERLEENHLCDYTGKIKGNCYVKEYIEFKPEMLYKDTIDDSLMNQIEQVTVHCM